MAIFKEESYKGFCVYSYMQRVSNVRKNNGNRYKMLFCIAKPTENKNVKGITIASGFLSGDEAKKYIDKKYLMTA